MTSIKKTTKTKTVAKLILKRTEVDEYSLPLPHDLQFKEENA